MNYDQMIEKLTAGNCRVVFTKADGTRREMVCTLHEAALPQTVQRATTDTDVVRVWEIAKQQWRSFRVDSIISFD